MSRKQKWKGVPLNNKNIDEYMDDLYNDTKGQYITQGVSFNKDDNFQMNLLKNALLSHGSFSGFIKHLMYSYFEQNNRLDESIWIPNANTNAVLPSPTPIQEPKAKETELEDEVLQDGTQDDEIQDEVNDVVEQDNPPASPASIPSQEQDENSGKNQNNNQRNGKKVQLKGGGSLNKALLQQ